MTKVIHGSFNCSLTGFLFAVLQDTWSDRALGLFLNGPNEVNGKSTPGSRQFLTTVGGNEMDFFEDVSDSLL